MQTLQTSHMPSTMSTTTTFSNNSGHHRMGSGELDVFEASRYFSGDIDGLSLGFGSWSASTKKNNYNINRKKSLELLISTQQQQQQQEALATDHEKQINKVEKKRASSCKALNSPTAKLANYFNSFLLQRSSKKKSINSKSKNKSMQSLKKSDDDESHHHHHHLHRHESMSFRSYGDCSKSYSSCVFGTPRITQAQAGGGGERRTRTISNHYIERRNINGEYRMKKVRDEVEVEDDGESDSSSDLFELRNMEAIGDGPNELPVYGTTSFEAAIASAILL